MPNAPPKARNFFGTINLGFSVPESKGSNSNVSILLKKFMDFLKQTDPDFCTEPLNGSDQYITNPSNIPTSREGIEPYYQHKVVTDVIWGKINITMTCTMVEMKDSSKPLRKYLNQDKVYVSPAVLGLVDTRIIGAMLQTDPQLTFRNDSKASVVDIMSDNTPLSGFVKRVRELNLYDDNPRTLH
jgi:hypothetical protein